MSHVSNFFGIFFAENILFRVYASHHGGGGKWSAPSKCSRRDECRCSHNLMEVMYHPKIYKTCPCHHMKRSGHY